MEERYKRKIITIPNVLSLFRLLLIPVIMWLYMLDMMLESLGALVTCLLILLDNGKHPLIQNRQVGQRIQ